MGWAHRRGRLGRCVSGQCDHRAGLCSRAVAGGGRVDAHTAQAWGLVTQVVPASRMRRASRRNCLPHRLPGRERSITSSAGHQTVRCRNGRGIVPARVGTIRPLVRPGSPDPDTPRPAADHSGTQNAGVNELLTPNDLLSTLYKSLSSPVLLGRRGEP
jgi:hypothetical protein